MAPGSIHGTVQDEQGAPVAGAMVSALGSTSAFAVTDRAGRFELRHVVARPVSGPRASRAGSSRRAARWSTSGPARAASSSIALAALGRRRAVSRRIRLPRRASARRSTAAPAPAETAGTRRRTAGTRRRTITARSRGGCVTLRRGILKDATVPTRSSPATLPTDDSARSVRDGFGSHSFGSPAQLAANFFAGTPFSGQVNLLTTGSFDTPQQLFSTDNFARSIAYLALGAPVGEHADWTVRAALTQGDLASWIVAGEYMTRAPARHRYDIGLSYSTQRYEGGNFAALRSVTDGSRNAGALYGFDTFSITPRLTLTYGGRYARYDYLDGRSLFSPRVALTFQPANHFRVSTLLSQPRGGAGRRRVHAADGHAASGCRRSGRSRPSMTGRPLQAERTNHVEFESRARYRVGDGLAARVPPARRRSTGHAVRHRHAGRAGGPRTLLRRQRRRRRRVGSQRRRARGDRGPRPRLGRVLADAAQSTTSAESAYLLLVRADGVAPGARADPRLSTSIETEVPETSTRVVVLYRVSNAFAARDRQRIAR